MSRRTRFLALFLVLCSSACTVRANLVINGSFELGPFVGDPNSVMSLNPGSTTIVGWTTFNAELAWIDNSNSFGVLASEGVKCLDLAGYHDFSPFGGVRQSISTSIGTEYILSFDLGSNPIYSSFVSVMASAGSSSSRFDFTTTSSPMTQWGRFSLPFRAVSTTTEISLLGVLPSDRLLIGLDNVAVIEAAAVPEPAGWVGLASGTLCIFIRKSRQSRLKSSSK